MPEKVGIQGLMAKLRPKCEQEHCIEAATHWFSWFGQGPMIVCKPHHDKAVAVAERGLGMTIDSGVLVIAGLIGPPAEGGLES